MKRGAVAAVVTIVFALAAAAGVFLYVQNVRQGEETAQRTVDVIVATSDIPAGQELDPLVADGVFVKRSVAEGDVLPSAITDVYQLEGQLTAYPILAGEQVSAARLQGVLQAAGGRYGIDEGNQAISLTLEPQRAAGGSLQEGDHVEAFGTFTTPGGQGRQLTRVLVREATVLHVRIATEGSSGGATVMLSVTPAEAQVLIYAQEQGHVWLTLLPPNEGGVLIPPVRSKELS